MMFWVLLCLVLVTLVFAIVRSILVATIISIALLIFVFLKRAEIIETLRERLGKEKRINVYYVDNYSIEPRIVDDENKAKKHQLYDISINTKETFKPIVKTINQNLSIVVGDKNKELIEYTYTYPDWFEPLIEGFVETTEWRLELPQEEYSKMDKEVNYNL